VPGIFHPRLLRAHIHSTHQWMTVIIIVHSTIVLKEKRKLHSLEMTHSYLQIVDAEKVTAV